jgi:26S proteasome regulatory subunit T1
MKKWVKMIILTLFKGVKESDTGLAAPNLWDIAADKQRMSEQQPLQVARCTKIIQAAEGEDAKYLINIKQIAKFVVGLGERVAPTDIEEGMRVGYVDFILIQIEWTDPSITFKYPYLQKLMLLLP